MAKSNSSKTVTIKPGIIHPTMVSGTIDSGTQTVERLGLDVDKSFAPKTPNTKKLGLDLDKGFAPKTPNTKGINSGKK